MKKKNLTFRQDDDFLSFKKVIALSKKDYKNIFYISTIIAVAPILISLGAQVIWGDEWISLIILQPLAWIFACFLLFLPVIFVLRFIVTRRFKQMVCENKKRTHSQRHASNMS